MSQRDLAKALWMKVKPCPTCRHFVAQSEYACSQCSHRFRTWTGVPTSGPFARWLLLIPAVLVLGCIYVIDTAGSDRRRAQPRNEAGEHDAEAAAPTAQFTSPGPRWIARKLEGNWIAIAPPPSSRSSAQGELFVDCLEITVRNVRPPVKGAELIAFETGRAWSPVRLGPGQIAYEYTIPESGKSGLFAGVPRDAHTLVVTAPEHLSELMEGAPVMNYLFRQKLLEEDSVRLSMREPPQSREESHLDEPFPLEFSLAGSADAIRKSCDDRSGAGTPRR